MFYHQSDVILARVCIMNVYYYKKFSSRVLGVMNVKGVWTFLCGKIKEWAMTNPRFQQKVENLIFGVLIFSREGCYISRGTLS